MLGVFYILYKKMTSEFWSNVWSAVSALATILTLILAWKAYKTFLRDKISEKQLDAVLDLVGAIKAHKLQIYARQDTPTLKIRRMTIPLFDIDKLNEYKAYSVVVSKYNGGDHQLTGLSYSDMIPNSIRSKLEAFNYLKNENMNTIHLDETGKIWNEGVIQLGGGLEENTSLYWLRNGKTVQFKEYQKLVTDLKLEMRKWLKEKAHVEDIV